MYVKIYLEYGITQLTNIRHTPTGGLDNVNPILVSNIDIKYLLVNTVLWKQNKATRNTDAYIRGPELNPLLLFLAV